MSEPSRPDRLRTPFRLRVEGWRGINHSIAMVNQHQLLAWMKRADVELSHRDAPMFMGHWSAQTHPAGFDPESTRRIAALPDRDDAEVDAVLRISSPVPTSRSGPALPRQITFMVTEFGIGRRSFVDPATDPATFACRGESEVITPTRWSRERLLEAGLAADAVHVVPHGAQLEIFKPMDPAERTAARALLGYTDEHFVFSNVGVATWNKGIDLLLRAFAVVCHRHPQARLILKDHKDLYGVGVQGLLRELGAQDPRLVADTVTSRIALIHQSLSQPQMRSLYALTDAYVSPYRAEGFNLPVLEALVCGTPAIVTAGGATDDFCIGPWATRLPGRPIRPPATADLPLGRGIEVDIDGLVEAMEQRLLAPQESRRLGGPDWMAWRQSQGWDAAAAQVLEVCRGH